MYQRQRQPLPPNWPALLRVALRFVRNAAIALAVVLLFALLAAVAVRAQEPGRVESDEVDGRHEEEREACDIAAVPLAE